MKNFTYIQSHISDLTNENQKETTIIFRLVNFNDTYFFAEEISTGCIFPIYNCICFVNAEETERHNFSYVNNGKYMVFYPLIGSDDNFKFVLDENDCDFDMIKFPTEREVKKYLKSKKNDTTWSRTIRDMEKANEYMCDFNIIKKKIATLKNKYNFIEYDITENIKYENYKPSIILEEIDSFGYDLSTKKDLCELIGRKEEIKKIIKSICIAYNSVILLGDSGSGKTSIVEKLALDIRNKENEWLKEKIIFSLSLPLINSNVIGSFNENLMQIIKFCEKYPGRIILFIDDIHNLYNIENSSISVTNMLKPHIDNKNLIIIGTTNKNKYNECLSKDSSFITRFNTIEIEPLDSEINIQILLSYINKLEQKYNVKLNLSEEQKTQILKYIVNIIESLDERLYKKQEISNPRISKHILEEAFIEAVYNKKNIISIDDICIAIISCDKLPPDLRKEKADELKEMLKNLNENTIQPTYKLV